MKPLQFMLIAGEASGDTLGAELISALKERVPAATFFGVGGARMAAAGMEVLCDFTRRAVFGMEAVKQLWEFRKQFDAMLHVAEQRRPDGVIGVDFGGFNSRFAEAVKARSTADWQPKRVQFVSPQVWASRPWRARRLAENLDLLLSIFPFEKAWYAQREPRLRVEYVGHPMVDRYAGAGACKEFADAKVPEVLLLPGSRPSELRRHLPIFRAVTERLRSDVPGLQLTTVIPEPMRGVARELGLPDGVQVRDTLAAALETADFAVAKSGTVTLECAYFRVPTVVMYKTSAVTYALAKLLAHVKWAAMPNLLANEEVFPEFVQGAARPEKIAEAALELMRNAARRSFVLAKLDEIRASLGEPGASRRAAEYIIQLLPDARGESSGNVRPPAHR
jgi:lipid-A-disaccharide synthase